jgi:hypothetical protein
MNWQKLDKKSLETLKNNNYYLVRTSDSNIFACASEYPYDVIQFIYDVEEDNGDNSTSWYSLLHNTCAKCDNNYEYSDFDLLTFFSHFCLINQPERSKREDSQYRNDNHELSCGCRYNPRGEFGHCISCKDPIHRDFKL